MDNVVVLGAAGKMGSGIALLLLQEMAWENTGKLTLLDANVAGFAGLRKYLRIHLKRYAERSANRLRTKYANNSALIDNGDMVDAFVEEAMDRVRCVSSVDECKDATLIFEAIIEDIDVKSKVLHDISRKASPEAYFFTNTSSIPIHVLAQKSGLTGRLIGFHFYNPPPVQKLVEVIIPAKTGSQLKDLGQTIGKKLNKTLVYSSDVAGFIGNGHFIREIVWACSMVRDLQKSMSPVEAVCAVNSVTQEFLLRPMGIFQLLDYVGIDVCMLIARIMTEFLPDTNFMDPLIIKMAETGMRGGQHADGSQKDGFFKYDRGQIAGVYDMSQKEYVPYVKSDRLGVLPQGYVPWKILINDKDRKEKIDHYFANLWEDHALGADLARGFLERSREIAQMLVRDGVAHSIDDVDTVLKQGFYHLYGVEEPFLSRSSHR